MPLWFFITSLITGLLIFLPDGVLAAAPFTCGGPMPPAVDPALCVAPSGPASASGNIAFNVLSTTFCLVRAAMGNAMFTMYCGLVDAIAPVVRAALALYIAIFSIAVMAQIVDGKDWAMRVVKISLIYMFTLNPDMFYDYLYGVFVVALPDMLSQYMFAVDLNNTGFQGAGAAATLEGKRMGVINNLDTMFSLIVGDSRVVGYMMIAVAFSVLIIGIPFFWLLLFGFLMAIGAFIRILVAYATALVALSFTLMFAPVFIPMLLFSRTSPLFFGWMRSVIGYSLELALILFFVFLIGGIKIMFDPATQDALMMDSADINANHEIVINNMGFAQNIKQKVPFFTGSVLATIGDYFYKMMFFCITYFLTSALLFGFMGKVTGTVQQLVKFAGAAPPVVTPGAEVMGTQKMHTMEDSVKGGISTIRAGIKQGQERVAAAAKGKDGGLPGAEKAVGGAKKAREGVSNIQEGTKETAEGAKEAAEGTGKAAAGTAKAGAGAGGVVGGVVAAPFTLGASLKLSAKGGAMMAEGGAQAAEGTAQAAQGAAKAVGGAAKVAKGTAQVAEGTAKMGEGAIEAATKKGDTRGNPDSSGTPDGGDKGPDGGGSGGGTPSGDGAPGGGGSGGGSGGGATGAAPAPAPSKASKATVRSSVKAVPQGGRDTQGVKQFESKRLNREVKVFEMQWDFDSKKEENIKEAMEESGFGPEKYTSHDNGDKISIVFKDGADEKKFEDLLKGDSDEGDTKKKKEKDDGGETA